MAEGGQKRSKTAHRTPAQSSRQWREYGSKYPERNKQRMKARREMIKAGVVSRNDGSDVGHKVPLSKGGGNTRDNLRKESRSKNRAGGYAASRPPRTKARGRAK